MYKVITLSLLLLAASANVKSQNTITPADKIYGLSKFWQEVNYNFIYLDKVDRVMWDNRYKELISVVQSTKSDYEYYRELQKFCALLKDGHTNVFFPDNIKLQQTTFGDYQLFLKNIDDKAIIVKTNLSKKNEIPIGSEIIEVNGKPTQGYIKEYVAPYISSSTDYVLKDQSIAWLLKGQEGDTYKIKVKTPDYKIIDLTLTHKETLEEELFPSKDDRKPLLEFKWIRNKIAYISLNSFMNKDIDSLFIQKLPELYKAEGLIIDLRYNPGGTTTIGFDILKYLTNDTILFGSKTRSRLHIPTYKAWGKYFKAKDTLGVEWIKQSYLSYHDKCYHNFDNQIDTVRLKAKRIVIPTALLIDHYTASAAEDFLIYADNQKHMIKIGSNTYGSTGQPYIFDLPGGGSGRVCTKQDTYPDGREFVGYGIKPDIEVNLTVKDYLTNNDSVLNKALNYLSDKVKH